MTETDPFTYTRARDGAWSVHTRSGTLLGTVRRVGGNWTCQPDGDLSPVAASDPTRRRAAARLAAVISSRQAHEDDNRPAPLPPGFEPADVTDLRPGDVVRPAHWLTAEHAVKAWSAADRTVRAVEVYAHGDGGFVRFERLGAGDDFPFLISNFGWRQYARRITA